jgi:hypothetical protein
VSEIGRKYILWRAEYSSAAYIDQMSIKHDGYIVLEEIPVTVVGVRPVNAMWGKETYYGWKALAENGEEFFCNWNVFPNDSMFPTFYWDARRDVRGLWQPIDAYQVIKGSIPYVRNNQRAVPQA